MIFTGIQPSGIITLGNYLGTIKNWQNLIPEKQNEAFYCIVDLHALTSDISPKKLLENTHFLAALYIALGIHEHSRIFIQSHVSAHSELAWLLQTRTNLGELERMTQFKDKQSNHRRPNTGLLTYPVLMAADILLYDTTQVPVGQDQKQHLELTRNIAQKINNSSDVDLFVVPEPLINKVGSKIYSLTDPTQKMSKSNSNPKSYISIMDEPKVILKKIKSSTTDSFNKIKLDQENQPGVFNLLQIYASLNNLSLTDSENFFQEKNYGFLKESVANSIIAELEPLQQKINAILANPQQIERILATGKEQASILANKKMTVVRKSFGLTTKEDSNA